jgi:hypothetical protein
LGQFIHQPITYEKYQRCTKWGYLLHRTYVCNTPILNSLVASAWLAASIPKFTHVLLSSLSFIIA